MLLLVSIHICTNCIVQLGEDIHKRSSNVPPSSTCLHCWELGRGLVRSSPPTPQHRIYLLLLAQLFHLQNSKCFFEMVVFLFLIQPWVTCCGQDCFGGKHSAGAEKWIFIQLAPSWLSIAVSHLFSSYFLVSHRIKTKDWARPW